MEHRKLTLSEERELWMRYAPPEWSDEKTEQFIHKALVVAPIVREKMFAEERAKATADIYSNSADGVLTTICIDQKLSEEDAVKAQRAVIEDIRKANYRWLIDAEAVFEYYSSCGWNPHIHIATRRIDKEAKIKGNLFAKFVKNKKHGVYNIDVQKRPYISAWNYISGKKDSDKKKLNVAKDEEVRKRHSIDALITI